MEKIIPWRKLLPNKADFKALGGMTAAAVGIGALKAVNDIGFNMPVAAVSSSEIKHFTDVFADASIFPLETVILFALGGVAFGYIWGSTKMVKKSAKLVALSTGGIAAAYIFPILLG